jgi:hypothetical protein
MKRIYKQGVKDDAVYFVAKEVEQTPAFEQTTLFLVGKRPADEIINTAKQHNCTNVYFGTGNTFYPADSTDWDEWDKMISAVLAAGFWATLDFDVSLAQGVHEMTVASHNKFIPMIAVKLAYTGLFNYNATLKIDDIDFDKSNPGVWCWPLSKLLDRDRFTDWTKYEDDTIL